MGKIFKTLDICRAWRNKGDKKEMWLLLYSAINIQNNNVIKSSGDPFLQTKKTISAMILHFRYAICCI